MNPTGERVPSHIEIVAVRAAVLSTYSPIVWNGLILFTNAEEFA